MHPGAISVRDAKSVCSVHVVMDGSSGAPHIDMINPASPPALSMEPGVVTDLFDIAWALLHVGFDAVPDGIYRKTGKYIVPAGRDSCNGN